MEYIKPVDCVVAVLEVTNMNNRPLSYQAYAEDFLMPPIMDTFKSAGIRASRFNVDLMPPKQILEIMSFFDAFVIMGGEDIHPSFYEGDIGYTDEGPHFPIADANQISVVLEALKREKKVFGICRGLQVINVALGGTLTQHLVEGDLHRRPFVAGEARTILLHDVTSVEGTLARKHYGETVEALTSHHQAVDKLGKGLTATAYATDGVIEAIEHDSGLLFGVQFHPEHKVHSDELLPPIVDFFRSN